MISGKMPLRHLVYRVQQLPQSMIPLVSDFGKLSDYDEELYTQKIVQKFVDSGMCYKNTFSFVV